MTERNISHASISFDELRLFCQNAQTIEVTKFKSIEEETNNPDTDEIDNELFDPESCAFWYIAMRSVEIFRENHGRYPGKEGQEDADYGALRQEVGEKIPDSFVREMIRVGDSKLHTVSAFLGGVASQEAIKMLIKQYTPFNHTMIYDGIKGRC